MERISQIMKKAPMPSFTGLIPGEQILFETRPAFWTMSEVVAVIFGILAVFTIPIVVVFYLVQRWKWKRTYFLVTNKRIITIHQRFFGSSITSCPHEKVQNTDLRTGITLLGRRGIIAFDTAGGPLPELVWNNLEAPETVYKTISGLLHK